MQDRGTGSFMKRGEGGGGRNSGKGTSRSVAEPTLEKWCG